MLPSVLSNASSKCQPLRIAILDTGLNLKDSRFKHLCPTGHKNFVKGETLDDVNNHGTFVAGLIEQYAKKSNYCMLIYKYYQESAPGEVNQEREVEAIREAIDNHADIINLSGGGPTFDEDEALLIKYHPEITFVVAAGNDGLDLDVPGNYYYPASLFYGNIEVVGNIDSFGIRDPDSNYGKRVENKEVGVMVHGRFIKGNGYMSGTSMSAAIFSGKLVDKLSKSCKYSR